ncbi:MAG: translation initiation factor IF-2 [Bacillota bacterium]
MAKKRVHEVAKELKIESRELIKKLADLGVQVKCNFSTLSDEEVERVRKALSPATPGVVAKDTEAGAPIKAGETEPLTGQDAVPSETAGKPGARPKEGAQKTPEKGKQLEPADAEKTAETKGEKPPEKPSISKFGPGLVDKVPMRPPDRRFAERPLSFEKKTGRGILSGVTARPLQPEVKPVPSARPEKIEHPETPPAAVKAGTEREVSVPESAAPAAPPISPQIAVGVPEPRKTEPRVQPGRGPEPKRGHRPGRKPQGHRPVAQQPRQDGVWPGRQAPRPQTGQFGIPSERKGQRPGFEQRPAKLAPIPPPPQEKGKIPQKQERQKADRRIKERPADRLMPQWEEEGEKLKNKLIKRRKETHAQPAVRLVEKKPIQIGETVTVKELAEKMQRKAADLIKRLMMLGMMVTINQEIDADTAVILAQEFGYEVEVKPEFDVESLLVEEPETDPAKLKPRPPILTVMGHVDHGKTSLLDAIRKTNVTATEAGGITQHIGAYQVDKNNRKITFIDTPGHEAFTAMRARGAKVTDVAVLVVAADDGVKPQTIEAINHARAAKVPIVVALNKIDKSNANPDRVKKELADQGLVPEEWGGDTICVPVSALKKQGIEDLLEMILLVADVLDLKANPERPARGTIVESKLDKGRGPVATALVANGTLNVGDTLVTGGQFARVRAMIDDKGKRVNQAGPSTPVEVLGFSEVPEAGEAFVVIEERLARQIAQKRLAKKREEEVRARAKIALEDVYKHIQEGQIKELPLIVKADVQGSAEALSKALERLGTEEVRVNLIHTGVGAITETDIMLAAASGAIILGFNVRPALSARKAQEREKVDIKLYQVIYDAINDVKAALSGLLEPEHREVVLGHVEVRKVFHASKLGTIAGCYVTEGKISRDANVRVVRDGVVIHTGKVASLKRFKDDVREVAQGFECGLMIKDYDDIQEGDELEFFIMEAVKRHLE